MDESELLALAIHDHRGKDTVTAKIVATGLLLLLLSVGCASEKPDQKSQQGAQEQTAQPTQQPSQPPQQQEPAKPANQAAPTVTVDEARQLLITMLSQRGEEVLKYTTATETEFQKQRLAWISQGRPLKPYPYQINKETPMEVKESTDTYAFITVRYKNGFTGGMETMLFRLDKVEGKWLVANHTDETGKWWPQD